jgi:replicative DNA helicase
MFLHRVDDKFETGGNNSSREIKVIIGKHRNGPIGAVSMMIDGNTTSFLEVANEYAGVTAPQGPAPTNKYDLSDF